MSFTSKMQMDRRWRCRVLPTAIAICNSIQVSVQGTAWFWLLAVEWFARFHWIRVLIARSPVRRQTFTCDFCSGKDWMRDSTVFLIRKLGIHFANWPLPIKMCPSLPLYADVDRSISVFHIDNLSKVSSSRKRVHKKRADGFLRISHFKWSD